MQLIVDYCADVIKFSQSGAESLMTDVDSGNAVENAVRVVGTVRHRQM